MGLTQYRIFNDFALTQEQNVRMYGNNRPEHKSVLITHPYERLTVLMHFDSAIAVRNCEISVLDKDGQPNISEKVRAQEHLQWSDITRTLVFNISEPLLYHKYELRWELPPEHKNQRLSAQIQWKAEKIQKLLLRLRPDNRQPPEIDQKLQQALENLVTDLGDVIGDKKRDLECGLMVFDGDAKTLRIVAGTMRSEYYNDWSLYEGQGIAGRTHKTNKAHLFVKAKTPIEADYYSSTPSSPSTPTHEAIFSIPLRYPVTLSNLVEEKRFVIGVFTLGSYSSTSGLGKLFDLDDEEAKTLLDVFVNSVHGLLIPALEKLS